MRVDSNGAAGDAIKAIVAESLIESVCDVDGADMAVAGPAEIDGMDAVRPDHVIGNDGTDGSRPDEKAVVIEMDGGLIYVVVDAELRGIALEKKILPVDIGDDDLLIPEGHRIQAAIGIFFEEI